MTSHDDPQSEYYQARASGILRDFDAAAARWRPILAARYGDAFAQAVLREARAEMEALIPQIPYIGGDENHLTDSLIGSARCLALYRAMKGRGRSAAETGKVLYDAVQARAAEPPPVFATPLDRPALMRRRRERAERSQARRYPGDWVYQFVEGDGVTFDYGYDFGECGTAKFYRAQGGDEFLPYYCFLDFPQCELSGLGLTRTMTLAEGHPGCNFRFKEGGRASQAWPPPFLARREDGP